MTTVLEKTLKRELSIGGRAYILAISPEGLKLTLVFVAERGRFELPKLLRACRFSRPVHSTALPPLRFNGISRLR